MAIPLYPKGRSLLAISFMNNFKLISDGTSEKTLVSLNGKVLSGIQNIKIEFRAGEDFGRASFETVILNNKNIVTDKQCVDFKDYEKVDINISE